MKKSGKLSKWLSARKSSHILGIGVFMLMFGVIGLALLFNSSAAGERLFISPETTNVQTGEDFTVTLRMNGGDGVNVIDATVTYDQTKLQFKSIDTSASQFSNKGLIATGGDGKVNVVNGHTSGLLTGEIEVAKITFTAIAQSSGSTTLTLSGEAANGDLENNINLQFTHGTVNITVPQQPSKAAAYSIEPTVPAPVVNTQLGLRLYADANVEYQGGQITVSLPSGVTYNSPLNTNGSAFGLVETVSGTNTQTVVIAFVTGGNSTVTGKQLVATIPVTVTSTGQKSITFSNGRLADTEGVDIVPLTTNPANFTVGAASIPNPTVSRAGGAQLSASNDITDMRQAFTITNFDNAATYTITLGGQNITPSGANFSIPLSVLNGDHTLQVTATKDGANGNSSYTIRLRSPNVNRQACVDFDDLILVNMGYGSNNAALNLDFTGSVGLVDLMRVIADWGTSCV